MRIVGGRMIVFFAITTFWLVMMGLLAHRQWASAPPTTEDEFGGAVSLSGLPRLTKLGIFFGGQRIGEATLRFRPQENGTAVFHTEIKFTGTEAAPVKIGTSADVVLDAAKRLSAFRATFGADKAAPAVRGTVKGRQMEIVYNVGGQSRQERVPFHDDAFFSSSLTPLFGGLNVRPGARRPLALWNPLTRRMDAAWVENKGKTRILWQKRMREAFLLQLTYGSMTLSTWMTDTGDVLRQEAPFGIVLEKEE